MLQSALVEDLVALSPNKSKDDLFPADFPSIVIRQAMAKGFSLDEVIAVMRGLQAQRKEIADSDLVLMTLKKRSPLMTNPWTSERVLRETRNLDKIPAPSQMQRLITLSKKTGAKNHPNLFITENLLDSIPGGLNAPIARLLLVAALRCYDPGSRGEKGKFVSSDGRNSKLFQSYLSTESPLLKIRSEQQAMEAVKPFLHTLIENRCYTAYDILYNIRGIGELVSWNIPGPLAKSIYSVIEEIHAQSSHISKRNIIREARISANFERFLKIRERGNSPSSAYLKDGEVANEPSVPHTKSPELNALLKVKSKLETEVLGLPLPDLSISASELLFKAAFLGSDDVEDSTTTDAYLGFLQSLLRFQADGEPEALKQLIAARVSRAKSIADQHTGSFQLFAVETAHDLLVS
ncbi:LOW QUALITY PROTEIN: Hypothetical protein PHPALM_6898 [Phytophthora palmivora]|uniref:Uncharacterized protein n=1 Tax=Phytophthora palmivora TaxID=4796 RepID=A0A2P4YE08_9STRA|nr:LOW QUALITY PROTEIN: Hypothetical protein PHPALM_6898 [Phytophthora palmivora]